MGFFGQLREHAGNLVSNWSTYDAPFATRLGLALRNRSRALLSRSQCCGHPGQPGC